MSALPLLRLSGFSAGYGGRAVLHGIDLAVHAGETVAVLGRNGTGKTTLAHAVFNLGPLSSGGIEAAGRDVAGWPTHRIARLGLALVPQGRGLFPALTVTENLRLATLRRQPGPWTLERVFGAFPVLARHRATPSGALSGGERQVLAIGRALLTQPRLLVMDEPSEGLAPQLAEEVLAGTVALLARNGLTVLLAEQNVGLALRLCRRAVVLGDGVVAFDGASSALLARQDLIAEHLGVR